MNPCHDTKNPAGSSRIDPPKQSRVVMIRVPDDRATQTQLALILLHRDLSASLRKDPPPDPDSPDHSPAGCPSLE